MSLLSVRLTVDYPKRPGVLRNCALDIAAGEILGLVGESGSGKSTLALSIMRLLPENSARVQGSIVYADHDLMRLKPSDMRAIRGREIAMVLQSPIASLNPALRIGTQMAEAWRAHAPDKHEWRERALEAFHLVRLNGGGDLLNRYPRQLSVGQAQRVLIAMAILHRPRLIIADEPTSALDAITASEILALFKSLNHELNMAILFISHDLLSVASLCERVAILDHGAIVETGATEQLFSTPRHQYTRALLGAIPRQLGNLARAVSEEPVSAAALQQR
ncbi:MAG TPA: ABC transporter ATP-binding protein [Bryobacteraceae bacterium]|nr:ABC transporter ATP-binding protein [Bryobacteraceae bacterium]